MDTAKNISCMKTVVVIIFSCFFLFIATQSVFCQQEKSKMLVQSINNTQNKTINNLSVIAYSGKIYLMWLVKGQQKNCTFFIERSVDSEHFEIKAAKSGYPSPFDKTIMYCYVDSTPFQLLLSDNNFAFEKELSQSCIVMLTQLLFKCKVIIG